MATSAHDQTGSWWPGDWTLAPPLAKLAQHSIVPLEVSLGEKPGIIRLRTPSIQAELSLTLTEGVSWAVAAHGFRIRSETPEGTLVTSAIMLDAGATILELDEPQISFSSDDTVNRCEDGTAIVTNEAEHIVVVADWGKKPLRMAIVSGNEDPAILTERARQHLKISAHQEMDRISRTTPAGPVAGAAVDPAAYLASRLRSPNAQLPNAWLTGADGEPVWPMEPLFMTVLALTLQGHAEVAAGLIANLLVSTDISGRIPVSGGVRDPLVRGTCEIPVLVQLVASVAQRSSIWPDNPDDLIPQLHDFFDACRDQQDDAETAGRIEPALRSMLVRREEAALSWIKTHSGASAEFALDESMPGDAWSAPLHARSTPWMGLLMSERLDACSIKEKEEALRLCGLQLSEKPEPGNGLLRMITLIAGESLVLSDEPELRQDWQRHVVAIAESQWEQIVQQSVAANRMLHSSDLLMAAAFLVAARQQAAQAYAPPRASTRAWWWMNRRKRWLMAAAVGAALLFAAWVLAVHSRESLPMSVLQTRLGTIEQYYNEGEYEATLALLDELDRTKNIGSGKVNHIRGKVFIRQGRYAEAVAILEQLVQDEQEMPGAKFNLGVGYFLLRDYENARRTFEAMATNLIASHPSTAARARRAAELAGMVEQNTAGAR